VYEFEHGGAVCVSLVTPERATPKPAQDRGLRGRPDVRFRVFAHDAPTDVKWWVGVLLWSVSAGRSVVRAW
jgi:hypothetical protein